MDSSLGLLMHIAQKSGLYNQITLSTAEIAEEMKFSQQTSSRLLRDLEKKGLIKREPSINGTAIQLEDKAIKLLETNYLALNKLFNRDVKLQGDIIAGLGEGRFYVQQINYKKQFIEKMNINPYPGTLNLKVEPAKAKEFLNSKKSIAINGFKTKERTFGNLLAYNVIINNKIKGAIVAPERTNHPNNIIEVIAPVFLREQLKLKDGDEVLLK